MKKLSLIAAAVALLTGVSGAPAIAQSGNRGNVQAGHRLAMDICETCHIVGIHQKIPPSRILSGPSFFDVANRPDTTAQSLSAFLAVPHPLERMPQISELTPAQIDNLVSYILSLRGRH